MAIRRLTFSQRKLPVVSSTAGRVRFFSEEDIPAVADLHRRVFGLADRSSAELLEAYQTYFHEVFLSDADGKTRSLVYEQGDGTVSGFLGIVSRPMLAGGEPVQACISSQFIVDPGSRGPAGLSLLRAFLRGPQDLSIADEANSAARSIWEALGGTTSPLLSMRWLYPLSPCRLVLSVLLRKTPRLDLVVSRLASPLTWLLDSAALRLPGYPFRLSKPRVGGEELDPETHWRCLAELTENQLRPDYDRDLLGRLVRRASQLQRYGLLHRVVVRAGNGEIAGWYLYYVNRSISEVIQLHAARSHAGDVLDHLLLQALKHGSAAVSGRWEPHFAQALSDRRCLFYCGPQWLLAHSRRPELLRAFERGHVCFSRLDGEWCLRFR